MLRHRSVTIEQLFIAIPELKLVDSRILTRVEIEGGPVLPQESVFPLIIL